MSLGDLHGLRRPHGGPRKGSARRSAATISGSRRREIRGRRRNASATPALSWRSAASTR
jgi:hypothetical protein